MKEVRALYNILIEAEMLDIDNVLDMYYNSNTYKRSELNGSNINKIYRKRRKCNKKLC